MTELEALVGQKPTGCELHVNVTIVDWFLLINRTGYAITVVYAQDVLLKLLGDFSRTFIPGYPVTVFVSNNGNSFVHLYIETLLTTFSKINAGSNTSGVRVCMMQ
jgi:hypothetical protein